MTSFITIETKKGKFLVRPYTTGDERLILEGWKQAFGKEMALAEWHWKYKECPGGFRCLLCFSETGEVAVHYAAQVYPAVFRGERILGLHLTDTYTVPSYRWAVGGKHGLLVKVGHYFLKTYLEDFPADENFRLKSELPQAAFHYGFPGERHFRLGQLLLHYRRFKPGTAYLTWRPSDSSQPPPQLEQLSETSLRDLEDQQESLDKLWLSIEKKYRPFMVIRDWAYIKWRYINAPRRGYYVFFLEEKGFLRKRLVAWAAAALFPERGNRLTLLDFLAEDEQAFEGLLSKIMKRLATFGTACEVWLSGNHPWLGAFLRQGFRATREPLGIVPCTRMDRPGHSPDIGDELLWTLGESDLF